MFSNELNIKQKSRKFSNVFVAFLFDWINKTFWIEKYVIVHYRLISKSFIWKILIYCTTKSLF